MAVLIGLKKVYHQKVFYEANEVRKYSISISANKININYIKHLFNEQLSRFYDGIICISTNIEDYYLKYNKNTMIIPILSEIGQSPTPELYYSLSEVFKIGFTGGVSIEKENFLIFFDALVLLKNKNYNFQFNLYGGISEKENIKLNKLIQEKGLSNYVIYHGKVDQSLVMSILQKQHLLVLPRKENMQNKFGFSTKLSEYLVSGVPVLLTDVSDNLKYLMEGKDVIVANSEDPKDFALKITELIENYNNEGKKLSNNGLQAAKKYFDYKLYGEKLSEFLFKV